MNNATYYTQSIDKFFNYISSIKKMTEDEERERYELMMKGDSESKNALVESQLKWIVNRVSRNYYGDDILDLVQICSTALLNNIHKWNINRGRLSKFTAQLIRSTLNHHFSRAELKNELVPLDSCIREVESIENGRIYQDTSCVDADIEYFLGLLDNVDRQLVCAYYGIDTDKKTLETLGNELQISAEAVRKRINKLVAQMRENI